MVRVYSSQRNSATVSSSPDHLNSHKHHRYTLSTTMRIALTLIVVLLGANSMIDILDSDMMDIIEDRQNTIERLIEES